MDRVQREKKTTNGVTYVFESGRFIVIVIITWLMRCDLQVNMAIRWL